MTLLKAEIARTSIAATAKRLGYSRTTISLVADDKYPGKSDRIAESVLALLDQLKCPHLQISMSRSDCSAYANRDVPTSSPAAAAHWRACQSCRFKTEVNDECA